tara:strand:+ start:1634 stop:2368 length:735 start_codon:yes stop_codon:yes gene_type:complete
MITYPTSPTVVVQDSVLTPEECNYIIDFAKKRGLEENRINLDGEMVKDPMRTSKGTFVKHDEDKLINGILNRLSNIAGVPLTRAEPLTIQRYLKGQEYAPHIDAVSNNEKMPDIFKFEEAGNRAVTIITYLNNPDGGSTGFPNLGLVVRPFAGRILMFGNLDEKKQAHPLSLHMGLPPESGEKWIMTLWIRERDYMTTKAELKKAIKQIEKNSNTEKPKKSSKKEKLISEVKRIAEGDNPRYYV